MTMSGAAIGTIATTDRARYYRMLLVSSRSRWLKPVANGTGNLGDITAYGVRGRLRPSSLHTSAIAGQIDTLAQFLDGTASIVRHNNVSAGTGSATHFAYLPCIHFRNMDPYRPDPEFNDQSMPDDGSLPYLQSFLARSGAQPRAYVSVPQVETPLLVSVDGVVITLLDWRARSGGVGRTPNSVDVRVLVDFVVERVDAVRAGVSLRFNSTPATNSGQRGFWIAFSATLIDGEMVKIYTAKGLAEGPSGYGD